MDAGADDFISKPIGSEELRVRVRAGERILSLQHGLTQKNHEPEGINNNLRAAHKLIEDDLKAAAWMQQNLLPPHALEAHGVRCEWRLEPSSYVAGDTFNLFAMNAHQVCLYLLDVSGHGVPAAMLSVTLSSLLIADASHGNPLRRYDREQGTFDPLSPGDAIRELNRRRGFIGIAPTILKGRFYPGPIRSASWSQIPEAAVRATVGVECRPFRTPCKDAPLILPQ